MEWGLPMIKTIIFDFDGVILESAKIKTEAFADVVKDYPKEQADAFVDYHMSHMGISRHVKFQYFIENILHKEYDATLEEKLAKKFSDIVFSRVMTCPFVPGAREFLERNHQKYHMYIASGTPIEELHQIIDGRELGKYFWKVYGTPAKKEEIVEEILNENSYKREETIFVGDAITDLNAAKSAKLKFVGRNTMDNINHFAKIKYRVDSILEIEEIIEDM